MAISLAAESEENNVIASTSTQISENKKSSAEMVGGCSVCLDDQGTEENPLVYCDGCEVAVHQACYGIVQVPAGSWFCRKCESREGRDKIKCRLCPAVDGALKKTEDGDWAHVVCALYIPEVRFGNINTMEPIEINHIQIDRYNKTCYLCEENKKTTASVGAVMDCNKLGCKLSFHVTCAQTAGLLCEEAGHSSDNLNYCGYCTTHIKKVKIGRKKIGSSLNSSSSPFSDPASDSSQDADTRCNTADHDKNPNRTKSTSLVSGEQMEKRVNTLNVSSEPVKPTILNNNSDGSAAITQNSLTKAQSTIPLNSPKKKKKPPKNVQDGCNSSATNKSPALQQTSATSSSPDIAGGCANIDVYRWSGDEQNEKQSTNNCPGRKRQTSNSQSYSVKQSPGTQTASTNFLHAKIASPSLSSSSSPSLTSPSTSTKSNSNTSSTTNTTSSTPSSNSPSPALASPSVVNRVSTVRESPLASSHKAGTNPSNKSSESVASDVSLPIGQSGLQTRVNLDNMRKDMVLGDSTLLSTAVPHEINNPLPSLSMPFVRMDAASSLQTNLEAPSVQTSSELKISDGKTDTQPTVPPLIIPVPQIASAKNSAPRATAKPKAAPKTTKKKATATQETEVNPKPKASRSKRATQSNETGSNASKPEPKRGKAKSAAQKPESSTNISANAKTPSDQVPQPNKRKARSSSNDSNATPSPTKRSRKKRSDPTNPPKPATNPTISQVMPPANNGPTGPSPLMISTPAVNARFLSGLNPVDTQDIMGRYYSPMVSPYNNVDVPGLTTTSRSSLSRLFSTSAVDGSSSDPEDPEKAFEELRDNTWSNLSRCILDQAQQFDIPSLIGTLYTLRSENDKLVNRVRDLTMRRDQLLSINARLDLPGPMLTQHLNNTSPNFSSVVSGLTNSPKSMPAPSPGSSINKQPLISVGPYNHLQPGPLGAPTFLDRSSPLVSQTHSGINNIKSSISTPSPPIGNMLAHNSSNRTGLTSVNSPYLPNVFPQVGTMAHGNSQTAPYYQQRQT